MGAIATSMSRMGVVGMVGVLAACGGGAQRSAAPRAEPAVDESQAKTDATGLLTEISTTIGNGDTDGVMTLLAEPLVVFGPRRADTLGTRADALVALKGLVDARNKKKLAFDAGGLEVVASPGGHSAWAVDTIEIAGKPHAFAAVMSNADDMWLVTALAVAATPSMKLVRAELKKDAVVPPGMIGIAKADPRAKTAVETFNRGLADPKVWGDALSARREAVVVGPSVGDVTRGKSDLRRLWRHRARGNVRDVAAGELTAATTPDGQLAWVTTPVVQFADDADPLPLRVFAIFDKHGDDWQMIALQESLALDQPGGGAAFKKVLAPASAVKVEAPPTKIAEAAAAAPADKDPPPTKKKHKKHKKPPRDDDDQ